MTFRRYRARPAAYHVQPLGRLVALYDADSGDTHLLSTASWHLLQQFPDTDWQEGASLFARLGQMFRLDEADPEPILAARLAELAALGIIERAS